jgi:hypothetical protein
LRSMVNICEPLINVVIGNKPKVLICPTRHKGLDQKVRGQVWMLLTHPSQMLYLRRRGGT